MTDLHTSTTPSRSSWIQRVVAVCVGSLLSTMVLSSVNAQTTTSLLPAPERQSQLQRMVQQDCGSCHGLRLTGGLGPAITREALRDMPRDSLVATIYHGRPGTPMPPWKTLITLEESQWIADRLLAGNATP